MHTSPFPHWRSPPQAQPRVVGSHWFDLVTSQLSQATAVVPEAQRGYAELAVEPAGAQLSPAQQVMQEAEQPEQMPGGAGRQIPAVHAAQVPPLPQVAIASIG
jgi:hypothetical protein